MKNIYGLQYTDLFGIQSADDFAKLKKNDRRIVFLESSDSAVPDGIPAEVTVVAIFRHQYF